MEKEFEFTAEGVVEGFGSDPYLCQMLAEAEGTPEEFAEYLNEVFGQSGIQSLNAMFSDHNVELESGGEVNIREFNSFEEWAERTGFDGDENDSS
jgi:hypothetical protein